MGRVYERKISDISTEAQAKPSQLDSRHLGMTKKGEAALILLVTAIVVLGTIGLVSTRNGSPGQASTQSPATTTTTASSLSAISQSAVTQDLQSSGTKATGVEAPASAATTSEASSSTSVHVNGQSIELPKGGNGSVHKEIITDDGGKTTVDIHVDSDTASLGPNSSSLNLNIQSSQSSVDH